MYIYVARVRTVQWVHALALAGLPEVVTRLVRIIQLIPNGGCKEKQRQHTVDSVSEAVYNRWTGLDWNGGLAEIVPKLVPRLNSNSVRYLE